MKICMRGTILAAATAVTLAGLAGSAAAEHQPKMDQALKSLADAKAALEAANANKGGHRRKAISLIDEAIHQVREGKKFANTH